MMARYIRDICSAQIHHRNDKGPEIFLRPFAFSKPNCRLLGSFRHPPGANGGGELLQHRQAVIPVDAGIGHTLAIG